MYCFPSSNKLHQKKETGFFFLLFSGMEVRQQDLCSTVSVPDVPILFAPANASLAGCHFLLLNNRWHRCPSPPSSGALWSPPAISRRPKEPPREIGSSCRRSVWLTPTDADGNTRGSAGARGSGKQLGHLHVVWWGLFSGLILPRNPPAPPNLKVFQPRSWTPICG